MAIYRPAKARGPLAAGLCAAGLALGAAAGYAAGDRAPDPLEAAQRVRSTLAAAAGGLEVAAVEYRESVRKGQVISEPEYRGARAALASSRSRFEEVRPALELVAPGRAAGLAASYEAVTAAIERRAPAAEVGARIEELGAALAS